MLEVALAAAWRDVGDADVAALAADDERDGDEAASPNVG